MSMFIYLSVASCGKYLTGIDEFKYCYHCRTHTQEEASLIGCHYCLVCANKYCKVIESDGINSNNNKTATSVASAASNSNNISLYDKLMMVYSTMLVKQREFLKSKIDKLKYTKYLEKMTNIKEFGLRQDFLLENDVNLMKQHNFPSAI